MITRPTLIRDQAYDTIKSAILQGELAPNSTIRERELCEKLSISRTPVREALQRLELEGYLQFSPRQGVIIKSQPTPSLEELFMLLGTLEGLAAFWAAKRSTSKQVAQLEYLLQHHRNEEQREPEHDIALIAKHHQEFIDLITDIAGSDRLKLILKPLHDFRKHMMAIGHLKPGRIQEAFDEHWEIFQAIAGHNGQLAEQTVRNHLIKSLQAYQSVQSD
jgi:DNA-binding GntR family transcriptional regulator